MMANPNLGGFRLQPLRVPSGWRISNNKFYEVDPDVSVGAADLWRYFEVTLLTAVCDSRHTMLDLGWYPMWEPSGHYGLRVVQWRKPVGSSSQGGRAREEALKEAWSSPVLEYETRSRSDVVAKIEEIFEDICSLASPRYIEDDI